LHAATATLSIDEAVHVGAFDKSDVRFYDGKLAKVAKAFEVIFGTDAKTVTLQASGMGGGIADVLMTVKQGMCLVENSVKSEGDTPKHFFAQFAEGVCAL
jgi:hypothetical protein